MEVDRILYIFGSFTRKKQDKRKSLEQLSLSAGNSPLHAKGSRRPVSQNLNVAPRTSAYNDGRKSKVKEWDCGICKKELVEPRLLGCLHNFCTRCLQGLHQEGEAEVWSQIDGVLEFRPVDEVPAPAAQGPPDNNPNNLAAANSQFFGKDVRAQVITKKFETRAEYLKRNEEREEELHLLKAKKLKRNEEREEQLHLLKMEEQKWLVKAAEEAYQKASLERLNAAQLLQFSEVTREEAEKKN